jgi:hypothetical protein
MKITFDIESTLKGYEPEWDDCGYSDLDSVESARNVISNLKAFPPCSHNYRIVKVTRQVVK